LKPKIDRGTMDFGEFENCWKLRGLKTTRINGGFEN